MKLKGTGSPPMMPKTIAKPDMSKALFGKKAKKK